MNWDFIRREWGAVTFVLTVVVGMVVVPLALYLANVRPGAAAVNLPTTSSTARESTARTATSVHSPSPNPSPSK